MPAKIRMVPLTLLACMALLLMACSSDGDTNDPQPGPDVIEDSGGDEPDVVENDDVLDETDITSTDVPADPDICEPSCDDQECGLDPVCGLSCGDCEDGLTCVEGRCDCVPNCAGRECGDDGCGDSCGSCDEGWVCDDTYGICTGEACVGTACFDWFDCAAVCATGDGEEECRIACDDALRPESLAAKNGLVDCRKLQCGGCTDQACLDECDAGICRDASVECLVTYGCNVGSCVSFEACMSGCLQNLTDPEEIAQCEVGCYQSCSSMGIRDALALRDCLTEHCPETMEAAERATCESEIVLDPDGCRSEATPCMDIEPFCDPALADCYDCVNLLACVDLCPDDDDACLYGCVAASSEESYEQMQTLYECVEGVCDESLPAAEWDDCAEAAMENDQQCAAEAEPCVEDDNPFCDPATETCLDCAGLVACVQGCGDDDSCISGCVSDASVDAIGLMQSFYGCVAAFCDSSVLSEGEWEACVEAAGNDIDQCATQHGACFGDR